jgi:CRISPR-associated protein Csm3
MKLIKKIIITGKLQLITGLHIGDSKENVEIGGVDSPVVRRKDNNEPYIPGSSLKGKMRALLEIATGSNAKSKFKIEDYSQKGELIPHLFGSIDENGHPSRIIVRDAYLTRESSNLLKDSEFTDMPYSEIKFENVIDRLTGTTVKGGIRQIERIPAGASFEVEFVINIVEDEKDYEKLFIDLFNGAIKLLEDDYLGGSGTRGYGKVKFIDMNTIDKKVEEYLKA